MKRPIETVADANEFLSWAGVGIRCDIFAGPSDADALQLKNLEEAFTVAGVRALQDLFRKAGKL